MINATASGELLYQLVDRIAGFMSTLPSRPVTPAETPTTVRQALSAERTLPESGTPADLLLNRAADLLFEHSLFNAHPRFLAYITSSPAPIGVLADLLASAVNPNVGPWLLSPMASEIEAQTVRWIAEMLRYPTTCGGLFVSGGNVANLVCFLAARRAKCGSDVRTAGLGGARLRAYCSVETHTWIQKAADIAGIGTNSIRWIPANSDLQMDPVALVERIEADIAAGDQPFLVVGTAGTVSTGAVDPLPELARICRERNSGSTSTEPTAASQPSSPTPRPRSLPSPKPTPSPSIRTNGSMLHSKPVVPSFAIPNTSATPSRTTRPTTTSASKPRTFSTSVPRTHAASVPSKSGSQSSTSGAKATSSSCPTTSASRKSSFAWPPGNPASRPSPNPSASPHSATSPPISMPVPYPWRPT